MSQFTSTANSGINDNGINNELHARVSTTPRMTTIREEEIFDEDEVKMIPNFNFSNLLVSFDPFYSDRQHINSDPMEYSSNNEYNNTTIQTIQTTQTTIITPRDNLKKNYLFHQLPPEIYLIILNYLDYKSLLNCRIINTQFYELSCRNEIWKHFYQLLNNKMKWNNNRNIKLQKYNQSYVSDELISYMIKEPPNLEIENTNDNYYELFLNKIKIKYEQKLRKDELIQVYSTLNKIMNYLPSLKLISYWFIFIGIAFFSILFPYLMDEGYKLNINEETIMKYYIIFVITCFVPVFICHFSCLFLCSWVYKKHTHLSYNEQNERVIIFSMTKVTSYLLDVTFETQLIHSIPWAFMIPIFKYYLSDLSYSICMIPTLITITLQKLFYFLYEVQREKLLRRKKWETFRSLNTSFLFQTCFVCFKLDNMTLLSHIFGNATKNITWTTIFIPAYIFGIIYCSNCIHRLHQSFYFRGQDTAVTRKSVMFIGCLVLYIMFFYQLGLKLDKPDQNDNSYLYIFMYWYIVWIVYSLLKKERLRSELLEY
ncbi:hypothetical protein ABK040_012955 [Willaertia magna]